MSNIFNYDNKFFGALGKAVDCCIVSVLWFFCCIPIFTIGASTTALYYTTHKCLRNGKGYTASTFFQSFKDNFKQSTIIWLIQMCILLIVAGDGIIFYQALKEGGKYGNAFFFFLVIGLFVVAWIIYTYAYTARFVQTKKGTLKNAAIFVVAHLPWSLLIILIFAVSVFIYYLLPVLIFILPGVVFVLYDLILEKIFRNYMSQEDLEKEQQDDLLNDNF